MRASVTAKSTYSNRFHVLLFDGLRSAEELLLRPFENVPNGFRSRYYVERRRACATFLEIADPKPGPGEFPLHIGSFLLHSGQKRHKR